MSLQINKSELNRFFDDISAKWPVYGPTEKKEALTSRFQFKKLTSFKEFSYPYGPTVIPPKKYLMPAREEILRFEGNEVFPPDNKDSIIFGLNKRDGEGIFYLDRIMSSPISEEHYRKRREKVKLIIIDSQPPSNSLNCDLYLQSVNVKTFLAYPFSEFGERLIAKKYFNHKSPTGTLSHTHMPDEVVFHPLIDKIVEDSRDHPIWDRLAKECFNCGICSYVCPLCYCFETEDRIEITSNMDKELSGTRERRWDSCMLPDFNKVTFHNFRPEYKDRIYNWYHHKFVRMPREYGFPGCIDCGRCIEFCPAKINYRDVLKELIDDYRK